MISVSFEIDISQFVQLDNLVEKTKKLRPLMSQGAFLLHKEFIKTFLAEGPGWAKNARGTKTLVRTGTLARSYAQAGSFGSIHIVKDDEAIVGSNIPYAHIHETGGRFPVLQKDGKRFRNENNKSSYQVVPKRKALRPVSSEFVDKMSKFAIEHFSNLGVK